LAIFEEGIFKHLQLRCVPSQFCLMTFLLRNALLEISLLQYETFPIPCGLIVEVMSLEFKMDLLDAVYSPLSVIHSLLSVLRSQLQALLSLLHSPLEFFCVIHL